MCVCVCKNTGLSGVEAELAFWSVVLADFWSQPAHGHPSSDASERLRWWLSSQGEVSVYQPVGEMDLSQRLLRSSQPLHNPRGWTCFALSTVLLSGQWSPVTSH